ncbi:hypothetical protein E3J74_01525 [Candidatus Bathyarchaeota archaeon]|nr:MAG: hypothetical protein E3J74_01525 [Candidatus Bathyarchaeota archaeon]
MPSQRKPVGDLGEILTTVFLAERVPQVIWVGSSNLEYDIVIPFPNGEIFQKPTAISVKTRKKMKWKGMGIPPNKQKFEKTQTDLKTKGWDFWIALMLYSLKDNEMWFKIHLIPSDSITDEWFVGKERQISIQRIEEEAKANPRILTFASKG